MDVHDFRYLGAGDTERRLIKGNEDSTKTTKVRIAARDAVSKRGFDASEVEDTVFGNGILHESGLPPLFDLVISDVSTKATMRQHPPESQRQLGKSIAKAVCEAKREIEESSQQWKFAFGAYELPSITQSILASLHAVLSRPAMTYQHSSPIDTNFIRSHALLYESPCLEDFSETRAEFINDLDAHIGRVTAKWKEQRAHIAVTNIAGLFDYGVDTKALLHIFTNELYKKTKSSISDFVEASAHPDWLNKDQRSTTVLNDAVNIFEIPSLIGSIHKVNALGDFCAKKNFMKAEVAKRLRLPIDRKNATSVTIGSGKKVITKGTVTTHFQFANERGSYPIIFHLLPNCIHDVILGKGFLKATRTFSSLLNRTRRVVKRVISGIAHRHFLYLGDNGPRFTGLLNGQKEEALADSGSKVLIMDEDYAQSIGIPIQSDKKHRTRLRFADNSTAITSGMTYGVQWEFGHEGNKEQHLLDFHILKNAPAAVILSDEFLFATNAYSEFDCYLVDEEDEDEDAYFFAIDYDPKYQYQQGFVPYTAPDESIDTDARTDEEAFPIDGMVHTELIRRGEEDDRIADLPLAEQAEARNAETDRRTAWDARQAQLSQQASDTSASQQSSIDTTPPPSKKSRWRFRLKRRKP